jgi:hypothetical protein
MTTMVLAVLLANQASGVTLSRGLRVFEAEACIVELAGEAINQARWGGRILVYDASVNKNGVISSLKRRVIEGRDYLAMWINVTPFENCLQRWQFEYAGQYTIELFGGSVLGDVWSINVDHKGEKFRLRIPTRRPKG